MYSEWIPSIDISLSGTCQWNTSLPDPKGKKTLNMQSLGQKALYKQCYDHLKLAKKKAFEHELFLSLIEILIWELELAKSIHPIDKLEAAVDKINEELKEAITSLFDLVEHYQIHSEFSVFFSNTPTGRLDPETLFCEARKCRKGE